MQKFYEKIKALSKFSHKTLLFSIFIQHAIGKGNLKSERKLKIESSKIWGKLSLFPQNLESLAPMARYKLRT